MAQITQMMIEVSYKYGKMYALGQMRLKDAKTKLISETGMNATSAENAIHNTKCLFDGKEYSRTMSFAETTWKLEKIKQEFGNESFAKALSAVEQHLNYFENLPKGGRQIQIKDYVNQNKKNIKREKTYQAYSWTILNENTAIKINDKSVFKHNGSGIPKDLQWFWGIDNVNEKISLELTYKDITYKAYIEFDDIERARVIWYSDLSKVLNNEYKILGEPYYSATKLQFKKIGLNKYSLDFLFDNEKLLDKDDNEEQEEIQRAEPATKEQAKNSSNRELKIINGTTTESIAKDSSISKYSLEEAEFICQIDSQHKTFTTKDNVQYMEGHHLIPCTVTNSKLYKEKFNKNIDCYENIVCICPVCHRAVHLGNWNTKEKLLKIMFKQHKDKLQQIGIEITEKELLNLYKK